MENKFLDAMMFRHATREFELTEKISDEDFAKILECGRLSPSSFGFEPWKFLVLQDEKLRSKLKEHVWGGQAQLLTASHFVIILARKNQSMRYDSEYIQHMLKDVHHAPEHIQEMFTEYFKNFQTDAFELFESERKLFDWSCKQCYIALANMLTGAATMEIDSCPLEGFNPNHIDVFLEKELDIDSNEYGVAVMAAFGYRKNEPRREKTRQTIEDITTWI